MDHSGRVSTKTCERIHHRLLLKSKASQNLPIPIMLTADWCLHMWCMCLSILPDLSSPPPSPFFMPVCHQLSQRSAHISLPRYENKNLWTCLINSIFCERFTVILTKCTFNAFVVVEVSIPVMIIYSNETLKPFWWRKSIPFDKLYPLHSDVWEIVRIPAATEPEMSPVPITSSPGVNHSLSN